MGAVDGGQDFREALLQVRAAVRFGEDAELAADLAKFVGAPAVEAQAYFREQLLVFAHVW